MNVLLKHEAKIYNMAVNQKKQLSFCLASLPSVSHWYSGENFYRQFRYFYKSRFRIEH